MSDRNPTGEAFRQFQYPTLPLGVSSDFKNRMLRRSLERVLPGERAGGKD